MTILLNIVFCIFAQNKVNETVLFKTVLEAKAKIEQNFHDDFVTYGLNIFDTILDQNYSTNFDNYVKKFEAAKAQLTYDDFYKLNTSNVDPSSGSKQNYKFLNFKDLQNTIEKNNVDNKTYNEYKTLTDILINKNEFYKTIPKIFIKNGQKSLEETNEILSSVILSYLTKEIDLETASSKTYKTLEAAIVENKKDIWLEFYKTQLESLIFIYYKLGFKEYENIDASIAVERICPTTGTNKLALEKFCTENKAKLISYTRIFISKLKSNKTMDSIVADFNKRIGSSNINFNDKELSLNRLISGIPKNEDYCAGKTSPSWSGYVTNVSITGIPSKNNYPSYKDIYIEKDAELRDRYKTYLKKYSELALEDYGVLLFTDAFSGGGSKSKNYSNQQIKLINPESSFFDFIKRMYSTSDSQAKDVVQYLSCSRKHEQVNWLQVKEGLQELSDEILILNNKFSFNINALLEGEQYDNERSNNFWDDLTLSSSLEIFRNSPLTLGRVIKNNPGYIVHLEEIITQIENTIRGEKRELFAYRLIGVGAFIGSIVALFYDGCSTIGSTLTILTSLMSVTSSYGELLNQIRLQNETCSLQNTITNNANTFTEQNEKEQENINDHILANFWYKYDLYKELDFEEQINRSFLALDALTLFMDANNIAEH